MIKKQLIDKMFSEDERADVFKLFVQIMKTEVCLVVREGLDEWTSPSGSNLAEPSMSGFPKDTCTVLTTSRPWKLADESIKNSQIDSLVEKDGINDPNSFSINILRCIIDETKDLEATAYRFHSFVEQRRKLPSLSSSPMLYVLVICIWADTIENKDNLNGSSLCAIYTTLLESLCKKANSATGFFNDSNPPPVHCFSSTSYIQPNIEHIDKLAEAACKLLFSSERESSIVFNDITFSNFFSKEEFTVRKMFALKAGILSNRKDKSRTGSANSFIHKTVQEFLAAFYIACNPHVINDVISRYFQCNNNAYLEISQVLIFLCGMNISAANTLSALMNQCAVDHFDRSWYRAFQDIIESGIREAEANKQDGIRLKLSIFNITPSNMRDLNLIWSSNTSNVQSLLVKSLLVETSTTFPRKFDTTPRLLAPDGTTSHFEFNLSSCHKLKSLHLCGNSIWLRESVICLFETQDEASSATSELPVWIFRNSSDPAHFAEPNPVLPSIRHIQLDDITCSPSWLRSLFSTLLTLDHAVKCEMDKCHIVTCPESAVSGSSACEHAIIWTSKNTLNMYISRYDSPGLWEALRGLNIKRLSLCGRKDRYQFKSVGFSYSHVLSMLRHFELHSIQVSSDKTGMWKASHGQNIESRTVSWKARWKVHHLESLSQSLASLKQLETLSIKWDYDNRGLWEALDGLNIKSLTLSGWDECLNVTHVNDIESLSKSLSSLKQLESLNIDVDNSPGPWGALSGLNIKSLTLIGWHKWLKVNHLESVSQTVSSFKQLVTLTICVLNYIDIQLPQSLKYLNIYCYELYPSDLRKLVDKLSVCAQQIEGNLEFGCSYIKDVEIKLICGCLSTEIRLERIPVDEYMVIQQELKTLKNVEVKRFRIYDRISTNDERTGDADSVWSVRGFCVADDDHEDFGNVQDDAYRKFIGNINDIIINRISMRFLISPASIS